MWKLASGPLWIQTLFFFCFVMQSQTELMLRPELRERERRALAVLFFLSADDNFFFYDCDFMFESSLDPAEQAADHMPP